MESFAHRHGSRPGRETAHETRGLPLDRGWRYDLEGAPTGGGAGSLYEGCDRSTCANVFARGFSAPTGPLDGRSIARSGVRLKVYREVPHGERTESRALVVRLLTMRTFRSAIPLTRLTYDDGHARLQVGGQSAPG